MDTDSGKASSLHGRLPLAAKTMGAKRGAEAPIKLRFTAREIEEFSVHGRPRAAFFLAFPAVLIRSL